MSYSSVDVIPDFEEPGSYIRYYGLNIGDPVRDAGNQLRFVRLLDRDGPLIFPYKMSSSTVAVDALAGVTNFSDLDPAYTHVYQVFLGVQPGATILVSHPFDSRLLKWDQNVTQPTGGENVTAVVSSAMSTYRAPSFELWIAPGKRYPALDARNRTQEMISTSGLNYGAGKPIIPQIVWIAMRYRFMLVDPATESDIYDKLTKWVIPNKPVSFGGTLREAVR